MPVGLANAPAPFQHMMNKIFKDMTDDGVVIYLDNILIYCRSEEDHIALTKTVSELLEEHQLVLSPEKCKWHISKVNFLGYIFSENGIEIDQEKIRTVLEWKEQTTIKEVQSFLGFANFYRHYIQGYSKLTRSLTDLTKKSEKFDWQAECQEAYDMLKKVLYRHLF